MIGGKRQGTTVSFIEYWASVKQIFRAKCGDPSRFEDTPDDAG